MERVTLGLTGLQVTPIAYGTWQFGGDWGTVDEESAIATIRRAHELGVNFFDTAQAYGFGVAERILGSALAEPLRRERDSIVIATKGGLRLDAEEGLVRDSSPEWLRSGVEESLANLGIDQIDLYQVHWPDPGTPFTETGRALRQLVNEGKIRRVGVSNFSTEQTAELSRSCAVEAMQPPYHLFRPEIEDELLPYALEHGLGVLAYGPLAHGLLGGQMGERTTFPDDDWRSVSDLFEGEAYRRNLETVGRLAELAAELDITVSQLAIAWTLAHPAVQVAIVGARSAEHLAESVAAAEVELGEEEMGRIEEIMADAVTVAGPSPETV